MFDLTNASKTQLVSLYRSGMERMGEKVPAVSTASKIRNEDLVSWINKYVESSEGATVLVPPGHGKEAHFADATASEKKTTEAGGRRGRSSAYAEEMIITVLVDKFPGREGSASYERRKLYRSGMTVGQFLAAADEEGRGSLAKAVRRGWVSVSPA